MQDHRLDWGREARTGIGEAVLAEGKTPAQLDAIVRTTLEADACLLVTRLPESVATPLQSAFPHGFHYHPASRTAVIGQSSVAQRSLNDVAIVAAGTSDLLVAHEACQTLRFYGHEPRLVADVGVAGLWRLMEELDGIRQASIVLAVAGMEGALFSVLAGLVSAPVIAVPTSIGYGVGRDGRAALSSALASCAPGIVTVNVDNGFGAAVACVKMLQAGQPGDDRKLV